MADESLGTPGYAICCPKAWGKGALCCLCDTIYCPEHRKDHEHKNERPAPPVPARGKETEVTRPKLCVCAENISRPDGGAIVYEIEYPDGTFSYMRQPFRKGSYGDGVWGWDGGYPLTLTPSFECVDESKNVRVHLHYRNGEIDLLPDSTVDLLDPAGKGDA